MFQSERKRLIDLALGFEAAPENVKAAAQGVQDAYDRVIQAQVQVSMWTKELEVAKRGIGTAERTLELALSQWEKEKTPKDEEKKELGQ